MTPFPDEICVCGHPESDHETTEYDDAWWVVCHGCDAAVYDPVHVFEASEAMARVTEGMGG